MAGEAGKSQNKILHKSKKFYNNFDNIFKRKLNEYNNNLSDKEKKLIIIDEFPQEDKDDKK